MPILRLIHRYAPRNQPWADAHQRIMKMGRAWALPYRVINTVAQGPSPEHQTIFGRRTLSIIPASAGMIERGRSGFPPARE